MPPPFYCFRLFFSSNVRAGVAEDGLLRCVVGAGLAALVGRESVLRLLRDPVDLGLILLFLVVREPVAELLVVHPILAQGQVEHGERGVARHKVTWIKEK